MRTKFIRSGLVMGLATILLSVTFAGAASAQQAAPTVDLDYQAAATLWMQKSAEYRAVALQAFNLAKLRLDASMTPAAIRRLSAAERRKRRAIVVDVDETVLDNSPSQAKGIREGKPFNLDDWYAWGEMRKAKAIPGAVDFLNYAVSRGVKVFFVSNRDEVQKQATIDNLIKAGFRDVAAANVLLRQKDASGNNISTKTPRREEISRNHRIVLLMGDNLDDFSDVFERKSVADRFAEVDRFKHEWGKRWIVLPNAMYGTWENAIYEYQRLTEAQKAERRAAALELP